MTPPDKMMLPDKMTPPVNEMPPNQQAPSVEGKLVKQEKHNDPTFLGLPKEIRFMIYAYLFPAKIEATIARADRYSLPEAMSTYPHEPDWNTYAYLIHPRAGQDNAIQRLMQVSWQMLEEIEATRAVAEKDTSLFVHVRTEVPEPGLDVGPISRTLMDLVSMPYWSLANLRRIELLKDYWLKTWVYAIQGHTLRDDPLKVGYYHCVRLSLVINRVDAIKGDNHQWAMDESSVKWCIEEEPDMGPFVTEFAQSRQRFMTVMRHQVEEIWRNSSPYWTGSMNPQLVSWMQDMLMKCNFMDDVQASYQGVMRTLAVEDESGDSVWLMREKGLDW